MVTNNEQTPTPPPIEGLPEQELRRETVDRINDTLGNLPFGPVADGTGTFGFKRAEQDLPPLRCSYFQFSKAYEADRQVGVQIALFGVFGASLLSFYKSTIEEKLKADLSDEERKALDQDVKNLRILEQSAAKDGIAPAENRYYFIPSNPVQPAVVSTESFIARAHKVNPQAAERVFLSELIDHELSAENQPMDKDSGQPRSKIANLQDFRDALAIVRGGDWFVREIIEVTPKEFWSRPGLTS